MSTFKHKPKCRVQITRECRETGKTYSEYSHLNKRVRVIGTNLKTNGIIHLINDIRDLQYHQIEEHQVVSFELEEEDFHPYDLENDNIYDYQGELVSESLEENYIDEFLEKLRKLSSSESIRFIEHHYSYSTNQDKILDIVSRYKEGELLPTERKAIKLDLWLKSVDVLSANIAHEDKLELEEAINSDSLETRSFLKLFKSKEKVMERFLKLLKELDAIDSENNWIFDSKLNSIVGCFEALEELEIIKKINRQELFRCVTSKIYVNSTHKRLFKKNPFGNPFKDEFLRFFKSHLLQQDT